MALVVPTNTMRSATLTVATHFPGNSIRNVAKASGAVRLLQRGCELEIFALKLNAKLGTLRVDPLALSFTQAFFTFIDDLNAIATKFNSDFILPEATGFNSDDEKAFRILRAFVSSQPLNLTNLRSTLIKSPENAVLVAQQFRDELAFRIEHQGATAKLFGTQINLGPSVIQIERAQVERLRQTLQRFARAKMGAAVPLSLRPLTPVSFRLVDRSGLLSSQVGGQNPTTAA